MQQQTEQQMTHLRLDKEPAISILKEWWSALQDDKDARASLRRCRRPTDAAFVPAYHELHGRLSQVAIVRDNLEIVAVLAANIREDTSVGGAKEARRFAAQAADSEGGRPVVSDLRFRRIMRIEEPEELLSALVRLVRLLERKVNLPDLAHGAYWWNDHTKRDWAYRYYAVSPPSEQKTGD